jgi:hypothetical protein
MKISHHGASCLRGLMPAWLFTHACRLAGCIVCMSLLVLAGAGCAAQRTPLQVSIFPPLQLVPVSTEVDGLRLDLPYGENDIVRGLDVGIAGSVNQGLAGIQVHALLGSASTVYGAQVALNPFFCVNKAHVMKGIQCSGVVIPPFWMTPFSLNMADTMSGIQMATAGNFVGSPTAPFPAKGAQLSSFCNLAGSDATLLQAVAFGGNGCSGNFTGIQAALFVGLNSVEGDTSGLQVVMVGVNVTKECLRGIQIGAANWSTEVAGMQIGIVNYCAKLQGVQIGVVNICSEHAVPFVPIINARF